MEGFFGLLLIVFEIPWVPRMLVCALEVSYKDLFQVRPTLDSVGRKVFQPCSRQIGQEQWKVADNEIVIIRSTGLASKPIILEPQSGVCFPRVFQDVGWWSVPWWEGGIEDVSAEGLRSRQVGARASVLAAVVASATTRVIVAASSLSQIVAGMSAGVEGVACITVAAETLMHWDRGAPPAALWRLVD